MSKTSKERLQEIAAGMQELNDRIVYVGGVMSGTYATDPAASEPRTTLRPNVRAYYNAVVNIGEADVIVSTLWSKNPVQRKKLS